MGGMGKWLLLLAGCVNLHGQYTAQRIGAPPSTLPPAVKEKLQQKGFRIMHDGSPYCDVWLRAEVLAATPHSETSVTLTSIPAGLLLGVVRFEQDATDQKGQPIHAGIYTARYSVMPRNEAHLGAARGRDFLALVPVEDDRNPNSVPSFDALVAMSTKTSRSPHPLVLNIRRAEADSPGFSQRGDEWVLQDKTGDIPVEIVVAPGLP